eukprot:14576546-Heterocapsa_arctica.AAC.1
MLGADPLLRDLDGDKAPAETAQEDLRLSALPKDKTLLDELVVLYQPLLLLAQVFQLSELV